MTRTVGRIVHARAPSSCPTGELAFESSARASFASLLPAFEQRLAPAALDRLRADLIQRAGHGAARAYVLGCRDKSQADYVVLATGVDTMTLSLWVRGETVGSDPRFVAPDTTNPAER